MKILLVTIIDNNNIGTSLQVYATVRLFEQYGHEVDVLNYKRDYLFGREYAQNLWKNKNWLSRQLFSYYYQFLNYTKSSSVKSFLKNKNIKLTKNYHSITEIKNEEQGYDLYVSGSDQVWNVIHNNNIFDEVYFLNFTDGNKISFSSSIGSDSFPEQYKERIKECLSSYSHISVREDSAVTILKDMGLDSVVHVLDPTLFFSNNEWLDALPYKTFINEEPFLLVYTVESNDSKVLDIASQIAKEMKLAIYQVSGSKAKKDKRVKRFFPKAAPELFLQLFNLADFVVVSSFHGTAFAINFNKQFLTVAPNHFNSRVLSLLKLFGLEERYVNDLDDVYFTTIDYSTINTNLIIQRKRGKRFLDTAFSNL